MSDSEPRVPERIAASAWLGEDVPPFEGEQAGVSAELSDVDEVALVVSDGQGSEIVLVHFDRVHAIALAGQLARAATMPPTVLRGGHVNL